MSSPIRSATRRPLDTDRIPGRFPVAGIGNDWSHVTDEGLVERACANDNAALGALLNRYAGMVHKVAMHFVRDQDDAQEIVQTVFLSAWRSLPTFQGRAQISSWLYRVAINASLMFLRARPRRAEIALDSIAPDALSEAIEHSHRVAYNRWPSDPDAHVRSGELRRQIQRAIDNLPDALRTVFFVRQVEGLSVEETARSLGLTGPAVKTRLHRARIALRAELKAQQGLG